MNVNVYLSIVVMSLVTALLRFLPFVIFKGKNVPKIVVKLEKSLPYAVMGMLVVYCLKDISFGSIAEYLPAALAVLVVSISYIIKRNSLVSIVVGTATYMVLMQFVF